MKVITVYRFRPNGHWNYITRSVYRVLLLAGFGIDRLKFHTEEVPDGIR
jgi:hypothetical protein